MDISKKIKEIRESKSLKQSEMADILGIEQTNYSRFERRGKKLTIEQLEQIASALGVSIKEILFDEKSDISDIELEKWQTKTSLLEKELELKNREIEYNYRDIKHFKEKLESDVVSKLFDDLQEHGYLPFIYYDKLQDEGEDIFLDEFMSDVHNDIMDYKLFNYPQTSMLEIITSLVKRFDNSFLFHFKKFLGKLEEQEKKEILNEFDYALKILKKNKILNNIDLMTIRSILKRFDVPYVKLRFYIHDDEDYKFDDIDSYIKFLETIKQKCF